MNRIGDFIGDLVSDPRLAAALGVVVVIVIAGVVIARATRAKRMKAQAKFVRRRD